MGVETGQVQFRMEKDLAGRVISFQCSASGLPHNKPGDVVTVRHGPLDAGARAALESGCLMLGERLGCLVLLMPDNLSIENADEAQMNAAGWYREATAEDQAAWRERTKEGEGTGLSFKCVRDTTPVKIDRTGAAAPPPDLTSPDHVR